MNTESKYKNKYDTCHLTYALNIIGGKWRLPILWTLHKHDILRYNQLKRSIEGITNMMLTQSLKDLEAYGIIHRKQYMEIPPRVEYSLTKDGKDLIPALIALAKWGKHINEKNKCD